MSTRTQPARKTFADDDTAPPVLRLIRAKEFLNFTAPQWIVKPWVESGSRVMLYGPSGVGKTFVALDMALSISTDRQWCDNRHPVRKTTQGTVIYICAEGSRSVGRRVKGWLDHHARAQPDIEDTFLVLGTPIQVVSDAARRCLVEEIRHHAAFAPVLIVIDTLAWCILDLDENQNGQMQQLVAALADLQTEIARAYETDRQPAILLVHHSGKDEERGARGASSLKAAMDVVLSLSPVKDQPFIRLSPEKLKDEGEDSKRGLLFGLHGAAVTSVNGDLLVDEDGDVQTTCVAVSNPVGIGAAANLTPSSNGSQSARHRDAILAALKNEPTPLRYAQLLKTTGIPDSSLERAIRRLVKAEEIAKLPKHAGYEISHPQNNPQVTPKSPSSTPGAARQSPPPPTPPIGGGGGGRTGGLGVSVLGVSVPARTPRPLNLVKIAACLSIDPAQALDEWEGDEDEDGAA